MNTILTRTFRADRHAPGKARAALRVLEDSLHPQLAEDVRLLVSELVTNSLRHTASSEIELQVSGSERAVRVDVIDHGGGFDLPPTPTPGQASGWGLFMVDRLADNWGVETEDVTSVWFEFLRGPHEGRRAGRDSFAAAG